MDHNKSREIKSGSNKSAYEVRTDVLRLALEYSIFKAKEDNVEITAAQVVDTATAFNDFISKKT